MPPKPRRAPPEEEVARRWATLTIEQRQALMRFNDPVLVEHVKSALQSLFEKQMLMHQMGIRLCDATDPFASSTLFTSAFELTWQIGRAKQDPRVVLVDPTYVPALVMKVPFLERSSMLEDLRAVLPDFLQPSPIENRGRRAPLPKARWKELFTPEPASIASMEHQLVKLVEQALWLMASDPALGAAAAPAESESSWQELDQHLADALGADSVPFESWMASNEAARRKKLAGETKKKAKRRKRASAAPVLETTLEEVAPDDDDARATPGGERDAREGTAPPAVQALGGEEPPDGEEEDGEESQLAEPCPSEGIGAHDDPAAGMTSDFADDVDSDEDGSVGMGVFHMDSRDAIAASDISCEATAASTPAAGLATRPAKGKRFPSTPPTSPAMRPHTMQPPQVVCYIWNQTSQFDSVDSPRHRCAASPTSKSSTPQMAPVPTPTGFTRGGWRGASQGSTPMAHTTSVGSPPVLSVVVKNTFVEIDDPSERHAMAEHRKRPSRSLSPSLLGHKDEGWHDHWHL